jgi:hypothetical protein
MHVLRRAEGRFYVGMALTAVTITIAGFGPALIDPASRKAPLSLAVTAHGVVFGAWVLLLLAAKKGPNMVGISLLTQKAKYVQQHDSCVILAFFPGFASISAAALTGRSLSRREIGLIYRLWR